MNVSVLLIPGFVLRKIFTFHLLWPNSLAWDYPVSDGIGEQVPEGASAIT